MFFKKRLPHVLLAGITCWPMLAFAAPRPPLPPWPEAPLVHLTFDEPYDIPASDIQTAGTTANRSIWIESWSGYALNRQREILKAFLLPMATAERWNLAPQNGIIRFWFKADWLQPGIMRGVGPGYHAQLLELSTEVSKSKRVVIWSLYTSPDGTRLLLGGDGPSGAIDYLEATISLDAGWHLVTLLYGAQQTLLYLDCELLASGNGVPAVPMAVTASTVLAIGSDSLGRNSALGQIDELATFEGDEPAWQMDLEWYFSLTRTEAAKGPVTPEEEAALQQEAMKRTSLDQATLPSQNLIGGGMSLLDSEEGFYFLTPQISGTNFSFTLWNVETNKSYNLLFSPQLPAAYWSTAIIGSLGQTNFTVPMTNGIGFFRAEEGDDWDGDGIKNWMDGDPSSTNVGVLTVTIEMPQDGTILE